MSGRIGRRTYMKRFAGYAAASGWLTKKFSRNASAGESRDTGFNVYFGDIHNHNSVGVALGTPERAFDIARSHLDFTMITPHAYADYTPTSGTDTPEYFKLVKKRWPDMLELTKKYYEPGKFVTFPGYERFSYDAGHYCILFPYDDAPLEYFMELKDFQKHAWEKGAMIWQHHPGYVKGTSGCAPQFWDPRVTPILEIFSEHGNSECDTAPHDYIRHSMGPRITPHTMQGLLATGYRFGVVASTDDHLGFPGAYGEGRAAVLAAELNREAVFDALMKRRTYGVTGDNILVDFRVNGHLMGEEMPYTKKRIISSDVQGWYWVDRIEVLKNNEVIHRDYPVDQKTTVNLWNEPVYIRIEYGWGPLATSQRSADYQPPVFDWDVNVAFNNSKIIDIHPCFQSGPLDENRRHRISARTTNGFHLESYTSRFRAFEERDTNAVVVKIHGSPRDIMTIEMEHPIKHTFTLKLSDLLTSDHAEKFVVKSLESAYAMTKMGSTLKVHRIIPEANVKSSFTINDDDSGNRDDWYYIRIIEKNDQLAWSSPIWVEKSV